MVWRARAMRWVRFRVEVFRTARDLAAFWEFLSGIERSFGGGMLNVPGPSWVTLSGEI